MSIVGIVPAMVPVLMKRGNCWIRLRKRMRIYKIGEAAASPNLIYTLNKKLTMSPSFITYSLPSLRTSPLDLAFAIVPQVCISSKAMTSARMKPRSKSVWILPAAWGAFVPFLIVQARHSSLPAVRKEISPNSA